MMHDYVAIARDVILRNIDTSKYDVFLFGSRAEGNYHEMSDIDVGVIGESPLMPRARFDIEDALENSIVPFKIDIIDFFSVDEKFKAEAMKHVVYWNRIAEKHN